MIGIRRAVLAIGFVVPLLSGTAHAADSLYHRVGGYDALAAVTDQFVGSLVTDPEFASFFTGLSDDSKKRIRQNVVDLLCQATGGPCYYVGRDLKVAHTGLGITEKQWDDSVKIFGQILVKMKVGDQEQKDLAALVIPLKDQIVVAK